MFVIVNSLGMRLCQDGRFRQHANFGSYPGCVKTYRLRGFADRRIWQLKRSGNDVSVVEIPARHYMDAAGHVLEVAE